MRNPRMLHTLSTHCNCLTSTALLSRSVYTIPQFKPLVLTYASFLIVFANQSGRAEWKMRKEMLWPCIAFVRCRDNGGVLMT